MSLMTVTKGERHKRVQSNSLKDQYWESYNGKVKLVKDSQGKVSGNGNVRITVEDPTQ